MNAPPGIHVYDYEEQDSPMYDSPSEKVRRLRHQQYMEQQKQQVGSGDSPDAASPLNIYPQSKNDKIALIRGKLQNVGEAADDP